MEQDVHTPLRYAALFDPATLANPWPLYRQMREEDPVHFLEPAQFWMVTRYKDVVELLRDPRMSADRSPLTIRTLSQIDMSIVKDFMKLFYNMMIFKDAPDHTTLRKIANQGFLTKFTDMWRRMTRKIINELIDRVESKGRMELINDFAYILPGEIIAEIFGIPKEDREKFQRWSTTIGDFAGIVASDNLEALARECNEASANLTAYFHQKIEERKADPKDDVISLLIAGYEGGKLNYDDLTSQCFLIVSAGFLTTVEMISNTFGQLLSHADQLQKLRTNPALLDSTVDECLRYDPSVPTTFRIATEDITVGGKVIPKGHIVALSIAAANRDPEQFDSPDVLDITRTPNKHVAFGFGAHYCLGAPLAKIEISLALEILFERLPNLRFDEQNPPEIKAETLWFKGYKSMWLKF